MDNIKERFKKEFEVATVYRVGSPAGKKLLAFIAQELEALASEIYSHVDTYEAEPFTLESAVTLIRNRATELK